MTDIFRSVRYAARQLRRAPVFTVAAVLTLALGIGGTTAIFTLIHAVMLRSLPVADPGAPLPHRRRRRLLRARADRRIAGACSRIPLFERLKAEAPEFEQLAAFQAGGARLSVRRAGRRQRGQAAAHPSTSPATTSRRSASARSAAACFTAGRRHAVGAAGRRAEPSRLAERLRRRPVGRRLHASSSKGHPFTVVGVAPPGFFGETLRGDPPDLWIPLQQEPLIDGGGSLLRQSVSAWLRVIGRLQAGRLDRRHGAAADRRPAAVDAARLRLSRELDARRHPHAAEAGRSTSCRPAPASA